MIIFPAIDIKDGKVVRLLQGKFDEVTEYDHSPVTVAKKWESLNAEWLHIVDLDGAKDGQLTNDATIIDIAQTLNIPIEVGGGIRNIDDISKLIDGGVKRVIIGTRAVEDRAFLKEAIEKYNEQIAVSLDCSNGFVAQRGWVETTDIKATDLVKELEQIGLQCIIYTDIARDGMLTGPNFEALEEMLEATSIPIIASGGVSSIEDLERLAQLENKGLIGAITGKAIYEGKIDLAEALKRC